MGFVRGEKGKTMSDLISRQAAIDALERKQSYVERPITETRWFDLGLRKAQEVLGELPSAQTEIVRCGECKYYDEKDHNCLDEMAYARCWMPMDFCSFGERREG